MTATPEATAELLALMREMNGKLDRLLAGGANAAPRGGNAAGGARFGNYGRSKGQPVAGATMQDLTYYRGGCVRTLDDPAKARFHDAERTLLAAIDAEIARQGGGERDTGFELPGERPLDFDRRPPPDDTDVPF